MLSEIYHIGMIVEHLDDTVARLTRELGLAWSSLVEVELDMWMRDHGVVRVRPRAIYSRAAPHLEVIEAIPGTILAHVPGRLIHHVGRWTDDLHGDSAALAASGCPKILCGDDDGRMFGMAYHETADGLIVEIVDRSVFPDWQGFLDGRIVHEVGQAGPDGIAAQRSA